jgi:hypothetical protein
MDVLMRQQVDVFQIGMLLAMRASEILQAQIAVGIR